LSGGGTAGHIYPALTVAGLLGENGRDEVLFVGTPDGLEARLVPEAGVVFHAIASKGFDRGNPLTLVTSGVRVLFSVCSATVLLRRYRPDVVAGFGGYVSLPVGIAAVLTRTPLVLHEQNSVPGLANKILSRWAYAVGVTYEGSIKHLNCPERALVTGNPVRTAILGADRGSGRRELGLDAGGVVVLVFGGSRGARRLNEALARLWPVLSRESGLQVVHVAGKLDAASVAEQMADALADPAGRYRLYEYVERMGDALAAADVVVARAGATSIAEITAVPRCLSRTRMRPMTTRRSMRVLWLRVVRRSSYPTTRPMETHSTALSSVLCAMARSVRRWQRPLPRSVDLMRASAWPRWCAGP
jgi:UDP-N-acetylglucosamine--N-acetylmuramyl-(pentapeptide) pyrophosphoryl-undecaprenol N-acetylglucosamine transferase